MNILITSAGRRGYLIKYFKEALNGDGLVIAGNCIDGVPAFQEADKSVVTPMVYDENYIPFLLDYCKENKVDAILSVYDVDVPVLAHYRKEFEAVGTRLVVSDESFVRICNDKWQSYLYLIENGFKTPKTYLSLADTKTALASGELSFPLIVKPRYGNGSIGLCTAHDEEELDALFRLTEKSVERSWLRFESAQSDDTVVVQEMLQGEEYGLDIINDLDGKYRSVIIKRKEAMRSGETDSAQVVENEKMRAMAEKLARLTGHVGNLDCDAFWVDGEPYVLEMNARFGGGYPFSHIAGANVPKAIVAWLQGEEIDEKWLTAKVGVKSYKDINIRIG
ncbi:MAG: ATP-grasp domain-containing protein [Clostridiales bacterium]|nr:ATP-grasp domain-containing protein [Clostridiales bacterium]